MFRSTRRSIVFPQAEHARLAGVLAYRWGNETFSQPLSSHADLVLGVSSHDRGFGGFDIDQIGGMTDERWEQLARAGFAMETSNQVVDHLVRLHIRRLVDGEPMAGDFDLTLPHSQIASGLSDDECDAADRIVELCDWIAYDFCLERALDRVVPVRPAPGAPSVEITYVLDGDGGVAVDPWPFGLDMIDGFVVGYEAAGYPDRAMSVIVPFTVSPQT